MRHFSLNIERANAPEDEDNLVYASLHDTQTYGHDRRHLSGGLSLEEVQERFTRFHITPPEGLLAALNEDARTNAGNVIRTW
ncbi:hypothetical protein [Deinococcus aluminii]|uniref:Uncharacterized protein n=1 Tax=Deinococcus aluminii TaxID=1656885 RepID=A0ABP9XG83_9DEIO